MDDNNDKKSWISATETQDKTNTGDNRRFHTWLHFCNSFRRFYGDAANVENGLDLSVQFGVE